MVTMKFANFLLFVTLVSVTVVSADSGYSELPSFIERVLGRVRNRINQHFINFFESQRENFAIGWPNLGIPPIDPLIIEEFEAKIETISTLSSVDFRLKEASLKGLQQFEIENLDVRFLGLSVSFGFFFKQLVIEGQHTTRANLVILPISGSGPITMAFNNVRINGTLDMDIINGGYLNLKQMVFNTGVGSVEANLQGFGTFLDGTISALISNSLAPLINESSERINLAITESFLPVANEYLNQYRLVDIIFAVIGERLDLNLSVNGDVV